MKKKQKIIFIISLSILEFVGNVYLSEMLNTLLLGEDVHLENLNFFTNLKDIPSRTLVSDKISQDMKKRGFKFFGSTICYSFLQATGFVNDHLEGCKQKQR